MGARTGNTEPKVLQNEILRLYGTVTFTTSGAIGSQTSKGFTVTKPTGTGLYRITLDNPAQALKACALTMLCPTAANRMAQLTTDLTSNLTVDFTHLSAGSAANATSGDAVVVAIDVNLSGAGIA